VITKDIHCLLITRINRIRSEKNAVHLLEFIYPTILLFDCSHLTKEVVREGCVRATGVE